MKIVWTTPTVHIGTVQQPVCATLPSVFKCLMEPVVRTSPSLARMIFFLYQYGSIKMRINNQLTYKQTYHPYCLKMFPVWVYAMPFIYARYHQSVWYKFRHRQAKKPKVDFVFFFCKSVSDCI